MPLLKGGRLVLASHNAGKLVEIADLLAPYGLTVISAAEFGVLEPEETETSFAGNARLKARHAADLTGLPALADDSGMVVDALGGAPGVRTAHWAETPNGRDYAMAMRKVWAKLEARNAAEPRLARFVSTLCLAWPDARDMVFAGVVEGRLIWPPRGGQGFGFDPMFLPVGESETFGEMTPAKKRAQSHRAVAFAKLRAGCLEL